jgi:hypothetical protein
MYGLKREVDLTFLRGREVVQLAIGMHQVIFNFDEDISISIEGAFEYSSHASCSVWRPGAPLIAAATVNLLTTRVEAVDGHEDGTLDLKFSNGDRLLIRDTSREYESFQISRRGGIIVV